MAFGLFTKDKPELGIVESQLLSRLNIAVECVADYTRLAETYAGKAKASQIEVDALKAALEKLGVNTD